MNIQSLVRRRPERGAAAVEFALVLPVLILIIGAIIDFGFIFAQQISFNTAARDAARAGVLPSVATVRSRPAPRWPTEARVGRRSAGRSGASPSSISGRRRRAPGGTLLPRRPARATATGASASRSRARARALPRATVGDLAVHAQLRVRLRRSPCPS